jgi:hypothetical protein
MTTQQQPKTRFYLVHKKPHGPWARIWITDDGCFTALSDHGSFGYWWGSPGCEFREFLCDCDSSYLITKLSRGEREWDMDGTRDAIRAELQRLHDEGEDTREELCLLADADLSSELGFMHWLDQPGETGERWHRLIDGTDGGALVSYGPPRRVQGFVEHVWPLFVEQLRAELEAERAARPHGVSCQCQQCEDQNFEARR